MASATLTGTVKLNTTAFQRGLRSIKTAISEFHKSVAQPIGEAAANMARLVTKASMLGAVVAGFGVKKVFELEGMEESFTMLFRDSEKAKRHVKDITDLSAATPFDLAPFMEASRLLHVMGGDALSGKAFMTQMGDAAAMAQQPVERVAEWVGRMHASLKSQSGTGHGGYMLMQTGIIKPEELMRMQEMVAAGEDFTKIWTIMEGAMERARGSMARFSKGGNGLWSTLKDLANISLAETFKAFGKEVKGVMEVLTDKLNELRDSGAFEAWGKQIATTSQDVINFIWRIAQTWQNLNQNTREQLLDILKVSGIFLVAWRTGLMGGMIKALTYATPIILKHFGVIAAALAVVGVAIAGFTAGMSLGQYLEDKFDLSTWVMKFTIWMGKLIDNWKNFWNMLVEITKISWESVNRILGGDKVSFRDFSESINEAVDRNTEAAKKDAAAADEKLKILEAQAARLASRAGKNKDFLDYFHPDRIKENMQGIVSVIRDNLKDLVIPDALEKFLAEFEKIPDVKFPTFKDLDPLVGGTEAAKNNMQAMARMAMPLRGFFAGFGGLTKPLSSPAAAVAGAKQTEAPTRTGQEKQNQLLQRQVDLQEEMVRAGAAGAANWG